MVREGFLIENPTSKIKVAKPKNKVIKPYTQEEISRMLAVCDKDYENNAKFLGSRNRAIVLVLLDTGVRLSELTGIVVMDFGVRDFPLSRFRAVSCESPPVSFIGDIAQEVPNIPLC